jgi:hypothetical protein
VFELAGADEEQPLAVVLDRLQRAFPGEAIEVAELGRPKRELAQRLSRLARRVRRLAEPHETLGEALARLAATHEAEP